MMFETDVSTQEESYSALHAESSWLQHALDEFLTESQDGARYGLEDGSRRLAGLLGAAAHRAPGLTTAGGYCGISVMVAREPGWAHAYSHPAAGALDIMQYAVEEGPCLDALATGRCWYVPDLETETRWPLFTLPAKLHQTASVFVQPLILATGRAVGTLTLYSPRRAAYPRVEQRDVTDFAAALALASSQQAALGHYRAHPAKADAQIAFETAHEQQHEVHLTPVNENTL